MVALLLLSAPSTAATLTVGSTGYTSIQEAVDVAADGDTIIVEAGTYVECVDLGGRDLTLPG